VSLTELLVSLALLSTILASVFTLLVQGQRAYAFGAARVEAQQNARIGLERLAHEIRQAGSGAPGATFAALSVAEPARLVLHRDLDVDGVVAVQRETITWLVSTRVLRRNAGGGAQPIIEGVRSLQFAYFDGAGLPTTVAADVRTVRIDLTTEARVPSVLGGSAMTRVSTQVRLRNR
jgi:type II secretory pathway component PulJ